jgi:hypothetical protein
MDCKTRDAASAVVFPFRRTVESAARGRVCRALLVAVALLCAASARAQQRGASNVDLSGSYERYRGAPPVPQAPPPPLKPQYLQEWQAKQKAIREADAKGEPLASNVTSCIPDGMPGMMAGPFPMEILQSKGQVTIIQEAYNQVRRILLDQPQKPIDDVDPTFYGRSVGRWEGDTLVVDTVALRDDTLLDAFSPHSDQMTVHERIRFVSPGVLEDRITVRDPKALVEPHESVRTYRKASPPNDELREFACAEGIADAK